MGRGGWSPIPPSPVVFPGEQSKDKQQKKERKSPAAQRSTRTGQWFTAWEIRARPEAAKAKEG